MWRIAHIHKKMTLHGREKKADGPGTSQPEGCYGGEFPGFSFCLIYLRLEGEQAGNREMPMGTDEKSPNKSLLSLEATGPGKGQLNKRENSYTITTLLYPSITAKTMAHTSKGQMGSLNFHPGKANKAHQHPHRGGVREDQVGCWGFLLTG